MRTWRTAWWAGLALRAAMGRHSLVAAGALLLLAGNAWGACGSIICNVALASNGGKLTSTHASYYGTPGNLIDGTANTLWASNFTFANNIDLAFDPNLDGSTGTVADQFTLSSLALTGDGTSWMTRQFGISVQQNGSPTWQPLLNSSGPVSGYNFAMSAQGGKLTSTHASYYGTPGNLIDGTANTLWASNFTFANNIDLAFDPNLDGSTGTVADQFTLSSLALTGDGTSWMTRQFGISVQQNGSPTWQPLLNSSGPVSGYNFAMSAQGGKLTSTHASYYGTPGNLIDGTANTLWASNFTFANNIDLAFDPNLDGSTGTVADQFTLSSLALTGDGTSWMTRQFGISVQQNGSPIWQPLLNSSGPVSGYNFAMSAQGGKLTSTHASYYGTPGNLIDGTANTLWASNFTFANNIDLAFDPNLDGSTGTVADQFTLSSLALTGDGTSWMTRQFGISVQQNGSPTWQPLLNSSGPVSGYNFAMSAQGGKLTSTHASYYGTPGNLIDGTANTLWASNFTINNTIDLAFDPNLDGATGSLADQFTMTSLALTGDGTNWMLKQFQLWVNAGSGWVLQGTFSMAQNNQRQVFSIAPVSNVIGVRIVTLSNYGASVLSLNEIEVLGNGSVSSPLFTLAQNTNRQIITPDATLNAGKLSNVSGVRISTVNNYGGGVLSLNEIEVLGNGTANSPLFTLAQNTNRQLITPDAGLNAGKLNHISAVRLNTVNNYGGGVLSLNEIEVLGDGVANSPLFNLAQNTNRQVITPDSVLNAGKLAQITGVRVNTVNNYGGGVLSLNEIEVLGDGSVSSPLFTLAQNNSRQVFTPDASLNAGKLNNITGVRVGTVNNYGGGVLSLNDIEVWANLGTVVGAAAGFNCVEAGLDPLSGHLYTKVAGTPFSFDVVALKSNGAVETGFVPSASKAVTVELVDGSGATACASRTSYFGSSLNFVAADAGRKAYTPATITAAYPNVRCRVTDSNQSPAVVACSSDNFAIRPAALAISSTAAADATGTSATATPVTKAGTNFQMFALATANGGNTAQGYSGLPSIDASKLLAHSGALQIGALTGSFNVSVPNFGLAYGNSFSFSEVGYLGFAQNGVYDDSFAAVDIAAGDCSNDFSNVAVAGKYGCKFGNIAQTNYFGRFVPDHFALTPGVLGAACTSHPAASPGYVPTDFSYFGQDGFTTAFTLTAQNQANTTTQNYSGSFARLPLTNWAGLGFSASGLPSGSSLAAGAISPSGAWAAGVGTVLARHQLSRPSAPVNQASVNIAALPVDPDGVSLAAATVTTTAPAIARYGRMRLTNAMGPDTRDLKIPLDLQHFSAGVFVRNLDDSCTTVPSTAWSFGNVVRRPNTAAINPVPTSLTFSGGAAALSLSKPTGGRVTLDTRISLGASNGNSSCVQSWSSAGTAYADASTGANLSYLRGGSCVSNAITISDSDPSARASFGQYRGAESLIFQRENY